MTSSTPIQSDRPGQAPTLQRWRVPVTLLAVGTFAIGTDSFVLAGILPQLASGLHVSEGSAGQVVTAFAVTYAVAAPFLSVVTQRIPRKTLVSLGLALFVLANVAGAFAPTLGLLLLARVFCALGAASFTPTANAVSAILAGPAARGRALSITLGGIAVGTVFGVPVGTAIGQRVSWNASLLFVAAVGFVALVAVWFVLPHLSGESAVPLRQRFRVMGDKRVILVVAVTALATGSGILVYTYIAPILEAMAGITGSTLALALLAWGVGGAIGAFGSGVVADKIGSGKTSALGVALLGLGLLIIALAHVTPVIFIGMVLGGVGSWSFVAPNNHMLTGLHPKLTSVVISFNSTGTYVGQALGAVFGGLLLAAGLDVTSFAFIGVAGIIVSVILATFAAKASSGRNDSTVSP
jgi:predicted MFS family arabinose efflux permease